MEGLIPVPLAVPPCSQGVTSQGPNQFSVKGTITDASGVASVLRLTVS